MFTTSSLSTAISLEAVLDELVKIGEDTKSKSHPLRGVAIGGLGTALGWGAGELATRKMKFFSQPPTSPQALDKRVRAAKIILPILSGTAAILADRYRGEMKKYFEGSETQR